MIERIVIGIVISFILRQLQKFNTTIDWVKVKADLDERVAAVVPGTWFDEEAVKAVNTVVDAVSCALTQTATFEEILNLLATEQWSAAAARLKEMILAVWNSGGCPVPKAQELVDAQPAVA